MLRLLGSLLPTLQSALRTRADLRSENLVLRQQLAALRQQVKRPQVRLQEILDLEIASSRPRPASDRPHAEGAHREDRDREPALGCASRARRAAQARDHDLPAKRVPVDAAASEVAVTDMALFPRSVSRWMRRPQKSPSPTWRSFLDNHVKDLVSVDFFTVPTSTFQVLFGFLVLAQDRRRVVHFNVTTNPTAEWTAQQVVEAFPWESAPRYLLRDRDSIFGGLFRNRVRGMGIAEVLIAYRSPWQNPFVERLIGSIRRECLDHVIVLGQKHLRRILGEYFRYYHRSRTHLSLEKDCPEPRAMQPPGLGEVVEFPEVGGLHHRYERRAA